MSDVVKERMFPGGVYDTSDDTRSDVYANDDGNGTIEIVMVSGSMTAALVSIEPGRLRDLAMWLLEVAREVD